MRLAFWILLITLVPLDITMHVAWGLAVEQFIFISSVLARDGNHGLQIFALCSPMLILICAGNVVKGSAKERGAEWGSIVTARGVVKKWARTARMFIDFRLGLRLRARNDDNDAFGGDGAFRHLPVA